MEKATDISFGLFPPLTKEDVESLEAWYGTPSPKRFKERLRSSRFFNPKKRSLLRACLLVFGSVLFAWPAFRSPHGICAELLPLATLVAFVGSIDTARSLRKRWDFVHAGVLLLLYADMMSVTLLTFMAFYPQILAASLP